MPGSSNYIVNIQTSRMPSETFSIVPRAPMNMMPLGEVSNASTSRRRRRHHETKGPALPGIIFASTDGVSHLETEDELVPREGCSYYVANLQSHMNPTSAWSIVKRSERTLFTAQPLSPNAAKRLRHHSPEAILPAVIFASTDGISHVEGVEPADHSSPYAFETQVALIKSQYQGHLTNSDSYLAGRRKQNDASMNDKQWMSKRTNASSSEKLQQPRPRSWQ